MTIEVTELESDINETKSHLRGELIYVINGILYEYSEKYGIYSFVSNKMFNQVSTQIEKLIESLENLLIDAIEQ